jgi:predicted acylesterase/phospholipase RssA
MGGCMSHSDSDQGTMGGGENNGSYTGPLSADVDDKHIDRSHKWEFENLVIEGGSSNGTVAIGAYKVLERVKILNNIKRFAGSSVGSIVAAMGAVNTPASVIEREFLSLDTSTFMDDSHGVIRDAARLINEFGIYKGDALEEWVEEVLRRQTGLTNITFEQVHSMYDSELYITVANLDKMQVQYLNPFDNPDMVVSKAIRQSASIPWIFRAEHNDEGETIIDGGAGDNYPIDLFDRKDSLLTNPLYDNGDFNRKTIGLKMMSAVHEKRDHTIRENIGFKINSVLTFTYAVVSFWGAQIERLKAQKKGYWDRTITLKSPDRDVDDFAVSIDEKKRDVQTGSADTIAALGQFIEHGSFQPAL